jgi:large repetitive protein
MYRLFALAIVTIAVVVACDTVPLTSPTGSTISVSIDRSVLPLGGEATVSAVVTESAGTPVHNGTMVTFQTTVGSFNPVEAPTRNGVAVSTFRAGLASGTAVINAFSGSARTGSGNSSASGVTVKIGAAAAAGTISVSASPSSVSQSGGTVGISAIVFDEASNPLPGVNVQFVSSTGTLSQTTATTDSNGVARTQLSTTQTTTVTAVAGAAKGEVRVEASAAPTVTIEAPTPSSPVAGQPITFNVSTTSGNTSAPRQVQTLDVNFGDGTSETRANVTGSAAFTHTYTREGGYTITARAVDVAGNTGIASRGIVVGFAPTPTITITASKTNPAVNETITVTVNPAPSSASGAPIRSVVVRQNDGTVLYSSSSSGSQQFPVTFSSSGARTLTATTTDAAGQSASSSIVINVP